MNFDSNRKSLMSQLNKMHKEKERTRLNQKVRAKMHAEEKGRIIGENKKQTQIDSEKPKVLLFGAVKLFKGTVKSVLQAYCEVLDFEIAEEATDYIIDNHIPIVILDMDPPNDWKMCHDLFTTGKTMYPDIEYIVYHKEKSVATEIGILEAQGARIMNKPVDQQNLIQAIKVIIQKQKSSNG